VGAAVRAAHAALTFPAVTADLDRAADGVAATMDDLAPSLAQVEQLLARAKVEADEARRRYERIRRAALLARYQAGESLLELADREGMDRRDARSLVRETAAAVGVDLRTSSRGGRGVRRRQEEQRGQLRLPLFLLILGGLGKRW
jgi:hypothetical protein